MFHSMQSSFQITRREGKVKFKITRCNFIHCLKVQTIAMLSKFKFEFESKSENAVNTVLCCVFVSQNAVAMLIQKEQKKREILLPEHFHEARTL
jgi:hypothetical protein